MNRQVRILPQFISCPEGRLFVTEYLPDISCNKNHVVVFIPPFAEEMNRCRRMVSTQAFALARNGYRALIFDLYGTGDSEGDFAEARWDRWCENISSIVTWSVKEDYERYSILAPRFGALLAFNSDSRVIEQADRIVLWHPCTSGKIYFRQFLRLRLASQLTASKDYRETIDQLMTRFTSGRTVEIAGYEVSPELALSIESATLEISDAKIVPPIYWFDIVSSADVSLSVATKKIVSSWQVNNIPVKASPVPGDQFWGTVENTTAPSLIEATTALYGDN